MLIDYILIALVIAMGVVHTYFTVVYVDDIVMILLSDANVFLNVDIIALSLWSVVMLLKKLSIIIKKMKFSLNHHQIIKSQKRILSTQLH